MYHDQRRRGPVVGRREVLSRFPSVSAELWKEAAARFPVQVTRSWFQRMRTAEDPLALQVLPGEQELRDDPGDAPDPVGELGRRPLPWVVQKHPDRALLLLTRRCHLYCRYCFRRDQQGPEDPSPAELDRALQFLKGSGVREVILSGGDPLAVRDSTLFAVIDALRPEVPVLRLHTRAPITAPERVTPALVQGLAMRRPVWVLVHCNHPDELSSDVRRALVRLLDAGLPVLNQAVLLAGVNDEVEVLARLCEELVALGVFPYYLHHPDQVPGNAAFRLRPERGLELVAALAARVSGIALPRYVIDPPDGLGKLDVAAWVGAGHRRPVASPPSRPAGP